MQRTRGASRRSPLTLRLGRSKPMPTLFVARTTHMPPEPCSQEVVLLNEGFSEYDDPAQIPREQLAFLLVLGCLLDDPGAAREHILREWPSAPSPLSSLELLATDAARLQRHVRRGFRTFAPGAVFINGKAVAFRSSSSAAHGLAMDIVRRSVFRKAWQFWR